MHWAAPQKCIIKQHFYLFGAPLGLGGSAFWSWFSTSPSPGLPFFPLPWSLEGTSGAMKLVLKSLACKELNTTPNNFCPVQVCDRVWLTICSTLAAAAEFLGCATFFDTSWESSKPMEDLPPGGAETWIRKVGFVEKIQLCHYAKKIVSVITLLLTDHSLLSNSYLRRKLRYESSTLILCKELSSPIFQSLSVRP